MFDLFIKFSNYLFIIYILTFLFSGIIYTLKEFGFIKNKYSHLILLGKIVTVAMHINAFIILIGSNNESVYNVVIVGITTLAFIVIVQYILERVYSDSCPLIWNCVFFLLDIGIIMLQRLEPDLAYRQLLWIMIGFFVIMWIPIILKLIPSFEVLEKIYIILSFALIISTLVFGSEEYGSTNWIYIGNFSFQPSEIVKFLFVFYLASVFRKRVMLKHLITTAILSGGIVILLVIQRDLGSALIFFLTYMTLLYIATSNELLFLGGMVAAGIGGTLAYNLFSHVRVRFSSWINPWGDVDGGGYQIVQSLFAIGTGGLFGLGLTKGMPLSIPVVSKDFIFAAICEEFGGIFGISVLGVFLILFGRGMIISFQSKRRYYSLLSAGFTAMMAYQTFLIVGGVIKFIPLTGVTLPFISYGGTSVVVSIITIGFLQWLSQQETVGEERVKK